MQSYDYLVKKLQSFIRRYYLNELIKGGILFASIGLLYFLLTLSIEYFLWLNPSGRSLLFWVFISVEALLLIRFLVIPILRLFKLSKALDYKAASRIIGDHFPEVKDKLLNMLQLCENNRESDLLLASIDQKALELSPVPFSSAIDFKGNFRYLKFLVLPVVLLASILLSGNSQLFADSYSRVVNYNTAFEPPAPVEFVVVDGENLSVEEGGDFVLQVNTIGKMIPEELSVSFGNEVYFLRNTGAGTFEYTFESVEQPVAFYLTANGIRSREYLLEVVEVPRFLDLKMELDYPSYVNKKDEVIDGSGNARVPEGTRITWKLSTLATTKVKFITGDSLESFQGANNSFEFERMLYDDLFYTMSTSNADIEDYEELQFSIEVAADQYPVLELEVQKDSLNDELWYFYGKATDDYGLSELQLLYYNTENPGELKEKKIEIGKGNVAEFFASFPDTLSLENGKDYEFYFQLTDNDGLRNGKSVSSEVFSFREPTPLEESDRLLREQKEVIDELDGFLNDFEISEKELEELTRMQKEKGQLNFNDQKKLDAFLKRQQQQMDWMKKYSERLEENLKGGVVPVEGEEKKFLEERLERREERLEENERLLEELKEYSDKISKEELLEKLEELSRHQRNEERNLEQLLELTKRYYVEQKAFHLKNRLESLAERQVVESDSEKADVLGQQDSLNRDFNSIEDELEDLTRENGKLREPMELGMDAGKRETIKEYQEKALEELKNGNRQLSREHQKNAAAKMKEFAEGMKRERAMAAERQMQEDVKMLRQILDNLLVFSFEQEALLEDFGSMERNSALYASRLRHQNVLKEHFAHVDDSLFALALRNPMFTEKLTENVKDISYDLEKALERLADYELPQGMASQQYVIFGTNELALFLATILENMQQSLQPSGGEGGGNDMQLPDLLQKQGKLRDQMEEGIDKKENGGAVPMGELESERLFEIYKEQQQLREAFRRRMEELGLHSAGEEINKEMKEIEEEILDKGFDLETLHKMLNLEHRMLELEEAEEQDGRKEERESRTNDTVFEKSTKDHLFKAREYFQRTEILNRQSLPLQPIYQEKVRHYFERRDH